MGGVEQKGLRAVGQPSELPRPPLAAIQGRCNQRLTGVLLWPRCFCSFSLQVPVSPVARISQVSFSRSPPGAHSGFCVSPLSLTHRLSPPLSSSLPFSCLCSTFSPPHPTLSSPLPVPRLPPLVSAPPTSRLSPTPFRCLSHLLAPVPPSSPLPLPLSSSSSLCRISVRHDHSIHMLGAGTMRSQSLPW